MSLSIKRTSHEGYPAAPEKQLAEQAKPVMRRRGGKEKMKTSIVDLFGHLRFGVRSHVRIVRLSQDVEKPIG